MRLIRLLKKDLAMEASIWVDRQLISLDQARAICRFYGVDYDAIRNRSTAYRVLVVLGFLFIGLSLITIIGANWDAIPRGVRMAGLLVLTAGTHGLGMRMHLSGRTSSAVGLFFLGNLFYGASIILVAQIYHLGEHMPDGVFLWAFGSLPFAVLLCNVWLTLFSGLLALLWLYLEFTTGFLAPVFLAAAFPLFLAAEAYVLVRARASTLLFLTFVASLVLWFESLLSVVWMDERARPDFSAEHVCVGAALFLLAHAVSHWLHASESVKAKDYGAVLSLWTLRFALLSMLVLSFETPWAGLLRSDWSHEASMWIVVAVLAATALWIGSRRAKLPSLIALVVLCGVPMVAVVATRAEHAAVYFQVLDNAALIATGIWLIVRGTTSGTSHYYFLGVATILLTAFLRYVDLIGSYLDSAILFMGLAVLLLGAARYWKVRQSGEERQ
ncbi:MAG: DUF2157 domain-containing protein [Thiotrichales bacterium]|nr:DUF2157 domain-containing protein [Thiotrichales bacterium]